MDSPGNDLESIAGQVAAGCNMVVFTTGNGSVTNFPFVPTIKVGLTSVARLQVCMLSLFPSLQSRC
jgi:altronate dehydratase